MDEELYILRENLKQMLSSRFGAKPASGGKEMVMGCIYCAHAENKRKLYVSLPTESKPAMFNCFVCGTCGLLTPEVLRQWGSDDIELMVSLAHNTKHSLSLPQNRKLKDRDVYYLKNNFISNNELSVAKLNFINRRLGTNLSFNDLLENKIVLNLYDLLQTNHIKDLTRYPTICDQLNESFLGFITVDNSYINMRNLREGKVFKSIDKRYVNYNIFNKFDNTERFFVIPTQIDTRRTDKIQLRISEGPFDILSVKYNLVKETDNTIYASILGSSYYAIIRYFMVKIGLSNMDIHIYKDSDILLEYLSDLCALSIFGIDVYIHENVKEGLDSYGRPIKDFGVAKDYIKERVYRLRRDGSYEYIN